MGYTYSSPGARLHFGPWRRFGLWRSLHPAANPKNAPCGPQGGQKAVLRFSWKGGPGGAKPPGMSCPAREAGERGTHQADAHRLDAINALKSITKFTLALSKEGFSRPCGRGLFHFAASPHPLWLRSSHGARSAALRGRRRSEATGGRPGGAGACLCARSARASFFFFFFSWERGEEKDKKKDKNI